MKKEEILAKSREAHKHADPYSQETAQLMESWSGWAMKLTVLVLFLIQAAWSRQANFSLMAVWMVYDAVQFVVLAGLCFAVGMMCMAFAVSDMVGGASA